jgi:heparanase 1
MNLVAIDPIMGFIITLFLLMVSLPAILLAQEINFAKMLIANIVVNGTTTIGETDNNYICATIDWFPSDTCGYNHCMQQNSSAITLVSIYIYPLSSTFIQHGLYIYLF